jgi:hypothetical protein
VDGSIGAQHEQEQQEEEQEQREWGESNSGGGDFPPSRQPNAPVPASTIELLDPGRITERQSPDFVQGHYLAKVASTGGGAYISIQNITLLSVEEQRDTDLGPEYLFLGRMWLTAGAGVPYDLLQSYRRKVARKDRLVTLRTRKRMGKEADAVQAPRRKQVRQSRALREFTSVKQDRY